MPLGRLPFLLVAREEGCRRVPLIGCLPPAEQEGHPREVYLFVDGRVLVIVIGGGGIVCFKTESGSVYNVHGNYVALVFVAGGRSSCFFPEV